MHLIENDRSDMGPGRFGADACLGPRENFVNGVYRAVDEATTCELARLRSEEGIIPTCRLGCCHCCRFHIPMNMAEAHILAQYIRREMSPEQIDALRARTQRWHQWEHCRPGRYPQARVEGPTDFSNYDHSCPLLVDGACMAYPVRPVVCRTHFVRSHPSSCCAAVDPKSTEDAPLALMSVVTASRLFNRVMKDHIEGAGLDFSRSILLLPHWLALEMGWESDLPQ